MLYWEGLIYMSEIVKTKLISKYNNDLLAGHFTIDQKQELIAQKYYWLIFKSNIKTYIKDCDICLASKAVKHKLCSDLQLLLVSTY